MPNVLITGAAGGIGRALVARFTAAGYDVIATDQVERPADLVCSSYHSIDLARTVEDDIYAKERFAELVESLNGKGLGALINNAAVQILGGVDSLTRDDWKQTLNVNLLAPFLWTQAFLDKLEMVRGCVINVSSIHAHLTKSDFVAYATSKAALSGMTKALAIDLGGRVRINAVEPAAIETAMLLAGFESNEDGFENLKKFHPVGSIGKCEEVANLIFFMVNGNVSFLHGACLPLDGGIRNRLFDPC